tara:strand:- start:2137 stop:2766 length:630 start_codon:yes stop_codon:yes gene_type:complete
LVEKKHIAVKMEITGFYSSANTQSCPIDEKPEYAFIGRSNVGKSSLINSLVNRKIAKTSSTPGKTQLINHIIIDESWSLVDLPGYGYAKTSKETKAKILRRIKEYLTQRGTQLIAVFLLIDIRITAQKIDLEWMQWLVKNKIYFIRVFTKCDSLGNNKIKNNLLKYNQQMKEHNWGKLPETIITSSIKRIGNNEIEAKINELNKLFQNI